MYRGEGMMRGIPTFIFLIPLEHRKVHDPQKLEHFRIEQLVTVVVLLRKLQTQLTACQQYGLIRQRAFGLARACGDDDEIVICRLDPFSHSGYRLRMIALQALHVVEDAQAALLAESLDLIPLFAAQLSNARNTDRHQRQAMSRQSGVREQVFYPVKRWDAEIWFIAAVAVHCFGAGYTRNMLFD